MAFISGEHKGGGPVNEPSHFGGGIFPRPNTSMAPPQWATCEPIWPRHVRTSISRSLPPLSSIALSLYRSPTTRSPPFRPFHLERSMRGAVAARLGRAEEELSERGNLSLFDCGNRSCRRRRPEAAGGREGVAVVSSHNKGRRQSCSSRAASPLTSGSHAHSLLRPLPVCAVFFSLPSRKLGEHSHPSAPPNYEGRGRNAVAQHTISASHIHT